MTTLSLIQQLQHGGGRHRFFPAAKASIVTQLLARGMPGSMGEFYLYSNGAWLFCKKDDPVVWPTIRIFSVEEVVPVLESQYEIQRQDSTLDYLAAWLIFGESGDSDALVVDTSSERKGKIIDCFSETIGERGAHLIIANDFEEFLGKVMNEGNTSKRGQPCYWLRQGFLATRI